jgi:hypothetical protein
VVVFDRSSESLLFIGTLSLNQSQKVSTATQKIFWFQAQPVSELLNPATAELKSKPIDFAFTHLNWHLLQNLVQHPIRHLIRHPNPISGRNRITSAPASTQPSETR